MLLPDWAVLNAAIDWLAHGLWDLTWWQIVLYTLVTTHLTIMGVTIFLHRAQSHRALELGPIPSHFFRFWLWLGTGMVTKEFVAIHRKHHAKVETEEDPHSPQTRGLKKLLLEGTELYRAESKNMETMAKYGYGTPDDWIERNLYTRYSWQGVGLMLILNLALFGAIGLAVWAVQMAWIPVMATGVINGIGHYWGYRNFESADASTNVSIWGIIIGGEELALKASRPWPSWMHSRVAPSRFRTKARSCWHCCWMPSAARWWWIFALARGARPWPSARACATPAGCTRLTRRATAWTHSNPAWRAAGCPTCIRPPLRTSGTTASNGWRARLTACWWTRPVQGWVRCAATPT